MIGIAPRPPTIDDIGSKPAPRRPVGKHVVSQIVEHLAVGCAGIIEPTGLAKSFARGLCQNFAREPRVGWIEPAQVLVFGHPTLARAGIAAAGEVCQRLEDVELVLALEMRRKRGGRRNRPVQVIAVKIIAGVGISSEAKDLRVRNDRVPGLHEGLRRYLPVGRNDFADPRSGVAFVKPPVVIVLDPRADPFAEGGQIMILGDQDEALPALNLEFGQRHVTVLKMLKIPVAGDFLEAAVVTPGKAMKWAAQLQRRTAFGAQLAPPMEADVIKRANFAVALADQQEALVPDLVNHAVTRLGHVFLARGELPDVGPHQRVFARHVGGAGVTLRAQRVVAKLGHRFDQQIIGRAPGIGMQHVGVARPGAAARFQLGIYIGHFCPQFSGMPIASAIWRCTF